MLPQPRASPPPDSAQKVHYKPPKPGAALTPPVPKPATTPAPVPVPTPRPAASTSYKPPPVELRASSPDADADGEGEEYGDEVTVREEEARDGESETIVRQLEKGLPRWDGFGPDGWMEDAPKARTVEIVLAVKGYKDAVCVLRCYICRRTHEVLVEIGMQMPSILCRRTLKLQRYRTWCVSQLPSMHPAHSCPETFVAQNHRSKSVECQRREY